MSDVPLSIFISYSRQNTSFVNQLEADLRARGFQTWLDRQRLEGGQDWAEMIEHAINKCQVMLVVISPNAIESKWVMREIGYAQNAGKRLIPLMCQSVIQIPILLQGLQLVEFEGTYQSGLDALLFALAAPTPMPLHRYAAPHVSITFPQSPNEFDLVVARPIPSPPDPNLNELYKVAIAAKATGNLERSVVYLQKVVNADSTFGNGIAAVELKTTLEHLRPIRIQRLREKAEQAYQIGSWGAELSAWEAILGLILEITRHLHSGSSELSRWGAVHTEITRRISTAEQNQQWNWIYLNAQDFVTKKQLDAARDTLKTLWSKAPYFGDPAGLAQIVGLPLPPSLEQTIAMWKLNWTRRNFARNFSTTGLVLWLWALVSISALAGLVSLVLQNWLLVGVVVIFSAVAYVLAYHRAFSPTIFGTVAVAAIPLTLAIASLQAGVKLQQSYQVHFFFLQPGMNVNTGMQVIGGICYGIALTVALLVGLIVGVIIYETNNKRFIAAICISLFIPLMVLVVFAIIIGNSAHDIGSIGKVIGAIITWYVACWVSLIAGVYLADIRADSKDIARPAFGGVIGIAALHGVLIWFIGTNLLGVAPIVGPAVALSIIACNAIIMTVIVRVGGDSINL